MSETVKSEFAVKDIVNSDIWLKDLQRGLSVAVEATSSQYDDDLQDEIQQISEGDIINATLESQNNLNTIWTFNNVEVKSKSNTLAA